MLPLIGLKAHSMVSEDSDTPRLCGSQMCAPPFFCPWSLFGRRHHLLCCNEGAQMIGALCLILSGEVLEVEPGEGVV